MEYLPRLADKMLSLYLESFGATLIVGPKWCGKTTTAEQKAKSILRLQDPDKRDALLATAMTKPSLLLKGEHPRLIDEWQDAPVLWDAVRVSVDKEQEDGLYILTGSTTVREDQIHHSGTGRIARLQMSPMSLFESQESNGLVSLSKLFNEEGYDFDGASTELTIEDLVFAASRGGWPGSLGKKTKNSKLLVAKEYLHNICYSDISTVDNVSKNPRWAELLLRSYARNISTVVTLTNIRKDILANAENFSVGTLTFYIGALERLFVIDEVEAWCPAIRSATAIRAGNKREFIDPSIAVAALGLKPEQLEQDLKTFGFIFECLCIRDLKVYSQALGGRLSYYRDRYGLEADAVLHLQDGRYALIEFKLGSQEIEEAATHLKRLEALIKEHNIKEKQVPLREPDWLIVITGGNMAYTCSDGVKVIPIGCLRD